MFVVNGAAVENAVKCISTEPLATSPYNNNPVVKNIFKALEEMDHSHTRHDTHHNATWHFKVSHAVWEKFASARAVFLNNLNDLTKTAPPVGTKAGEIHEMNNFAEVIKNVHVQPEMAVLTPTSNQVLGKESETVYKIVEKPTFAAPKALLITGAVLSGIAFAVNVVAFFVFPPIALVASLLWLIAMVVIVSGCVKGWMDFKNA